MSTPPTSDEVEKLVRRATGTLIEHTDAVVILTSWKNEHGRTSSFYYGAGNYFAGVGMMRDWLEKDRAKTMAGEFPSPPTEDGGEGWKTDSVD